jgi:hypothetical protein
LKILWSLEESFDFDNKKVALDENGMAARFLGLIAFEDVCGVVLALDLAFLSMTERKDNRLLISGLVGSVS